MIGAIWRWVGDRLTNRGGAEAARALRATAERTLGAIDAANRSARPDDSFVARLYEPRRRTPPPTARRKGVRRG